MTLVTLGGHHDLDALSPLTGLACLGNANRGLIPPPPLGGAGNRPRLHAFAPSELVDASSHFRLDEEKEPRKGRTHVGVGVGPWALR